MWDFVADAVSKQLAFLETEYGFGAPQTRISARQCSVEFTKENITVGVWSEYGTRPALFVKIGGKRVFINRLIAKRCPEMKCPVAASVFGRRFAEDDYNALFAFFARVLRAHVRDVLSGQVAGTGG